MTLKYELTKAFFKKRGFFLIIIFILLKCLFAYTQNDRFKINDVVEENKDSYFYYLNILNGKLNDSKELFIKNSDDEIADAKSVIDSIFFSLTKGEISGIEYSSKVYDTTKILDREEAFSAIYGQYLRIQENPENQYFIYENGWKMLLAQEKLDLFMLMLIIIIIVPIFCFDEETHISQIIKTTKYGKSKLFMSKAISIVLIDFLIVLICCVSDYIVYNLKYGISDISFPLQSLYEFSNSKYDISLLQMLLINGLNKFFGILFFSAIIIFLSVYVKKSFITAFSSITIVMLPYFIFSNNALKYLIPTPLPFLQSTGYFKGVQNNQKDIDLSIELTKQNYFITIVLSIIIMLILLVLSYRKFCNLKKIRFKKVCSGMLIIFITFCYSGCGKQDITVNSDIIFNSCVDRTYSMYADILVDDSQKKAIVHDLNSQTEYALIRDPFYKEDDSFYISNIMVTKNKIYYMKSSGWSNHQIIETDIANFKQKTVYEKIDVIENRSCFLGLREPLDIKKKSNDYISFFVIENNLFIFNRSQLSVKNLNTNKTELIFEDTIQGLSYYNNIIYYIDKDNHVIAFDLKTKTKKVLSKNLAECILVTKQKIFYINLSDQGRLYQINYDGSNDNKFIDFKCSQINYDKNYIYFSNAEDNGTLYSVKYDKTSVKKLIDKPAFFIYSFENHKQLYYMTSGDDKKENSSIVFEAIEKVS